MSHGSLKERLEKRIPAEKIIEVNRSFEVIGDLAITEIPESLEAYETIIGEEILNTNPSLKTVLKKSGIHEGAYRTQPLSVIAGAPSKDTIHHENNIKVRVNPETVYFSSKLSTERQKIAQDIVPEEKVLVLFSGVGPYNFVATRVQPQLGFTTGIELNEEGNRYANESIWLNKSIAKKHPYFQQTYRFCKQQQIPFHETQLLKNTLSLLYHFYEGDAHNAQEMLAPSFSADKKKPDEIHNSLFDQSPAAINKRLDTKEEQALTLSSTIPLNLERFIPFFMRAAHRLNLWYEEEGEYYAITTWLEKAIFLHALRNHMPLKENWHYDRIVMPLPKDAVGYLSSACKLAATNATIHLYGFVEEEGFPHEFENLIAKEILRNDLPLTVQGTRKVGQYAPRKWRVCCELRVIRSNMNDTPEQA